jgi:ABC-type uncharacterized transport system permease subunit
MTGQLLGGLLGAGLARGTPILIAAIGEVCAERAGVLNLGVEGMMLMGAVSGYGVALETGSAWLGLVAAALVGLLLGLLHALLVVTLRADQVVSGLALTFIGSGWSAVIGAPLVEHRQSVAQLPLVHIQALRGVPILGPLFFEQSSVVYLGLALLFACALILQRTHVGLHLRAVGQNPAAADAMGVSVARLRYGSVAAGGALAGIAGASLSLAITPGWVDGMTAGQGFIAIALVIFGRWQPVRAAVGALLFGAIRRLPLELQGGEGASFPGASILRGAGVVYLLDMLPYALTVLALVLHAPSRNRPDDAPAGLGQPYERGAR